MVVRLEPLVRIEDVEHACCQAEQSIDKVKQHACDGCAHKMDRQFARVLVPALSEHHVVLAKASVFAFVSLERADSVRGDALPVHDVRWPTKRQSRRPGQHTPRGPLLVSELHHSAGKGLVVATRPACGTPAWCY